MKGAESMLTTLGTILYNPVSKKNQEPSAVPTLHFQGVWPHSFAARVLSASACQAATALNQAALLLQHGPSRVDAQKIRENIPLNKRVKITGKERNHEDV